MKTKTKKIFEKLKNICDKIEKRYIIIFIIAVIVFLPYFSGEFVKGDDYLYHLSNLFSLNNSVSFSEGNFFPSKIRSVLANNMGYGNGIFYPQLAYYITLYIYKIITALFGTSFFAAVKIYEFCILFLSGIFMYKFMVISFKNKDVALLTSIIYMTAPYFITDIFTRMAYAEIGIFLFVPIVMIGINYIINKDYRRFFIYFVIGYSGMICSHLTMTIYFTIFLVVILLINIRQLLNKKAILSFILATLVVIRNNFTIYISNVRAQS